MYLKSIEVHGFKSFATKMVFEFHSGITAIVGPNGSGKSNVADAVRWVLGEQSAKQLRGAKMEDIIFAGTELRKPLGYAYVSLTINNADHKLAVPYEEVKIARRVYRSGESEYLLNGASCRLKDVQELLFDTGIGKEGYSIIGQGQIDKILSGKPEERRELFDEAAGIVKFKRRKAAAEKNLEEEQQNLVRIEDILSELTKQVAPLKEQAEKAKTYLTYRDELKNLDIHMFLEEYGVIHKEMDAIRQKQETAARDLADAREHLERTKEAYQKAEEQLEQYNEDLAGKQELLSQKKVALSTAEGNRKLLQEQISTLQMQKEQQKSLFSSLQEKMRFAMSEKERYVREKADIDQEQDALQKKQEELQQKIQKNNLQSKHLQKELEHCEVEIMRFLGETTDVRAEEQRLSTLLEQNHLKSVEITRKLLDNQTEAAGLSEILKREKETLVKTGQELQAADALLAESLASIRTIENENEAMEMEHRKVQKQYHIENSRWESLKNLTERYEGYGQSVKKVMEQKAFHQGILGVVADIIRVEKEYEMAIETALGGNIQNVVTDNEQTAKEMIGFLKRHQFGRATFLPLSHLQSRLAHLPEGVLQWPGVIGIASTLVQAEKQFSGLVEYLLGRFLIVDHIDHAIALEKKYHHSLRIVTKEGDLLSPGGSMSGGAFKNNHNLLGRRREMESLEKNTKILKDQRDQLRETIQKKEEQKEALVKQVAWQRKQKEEWSLKQNTAQIQYERAEQDQRKNREELSFIQVDGRQLEAEKKKLEEELQKLGERMEAREEKNTERKEQKEQLEMELHTCRKTLDAYEQSHSKLLLEIQAKQQSVVFAESNLKRVQEEIAGLAKELNDAHNHEENAEHTEIHKEAEMEGAKKECILLQKEITSLETELLKLSKEKQAIHEKHKDFFEKREELSEHQTALEKECYRLEHQLEQQKGRLDDRINYMWEQYELTYHKAEQIRLPISVPVSRLKQETAKLKEQIRELGDVNVNAVEQYQAVEERFSHLTTQHDDLMKAAEVLRGIIRDLDAEMRNQFQSQFGEINTRFHQVFQELFGGGRGTLQLQEDEDILECGIRIIAQPPGKKLQNMMQMSGGEKALTAIALLFAIQSLKPSPFCLLDEIEAALDDSNVSRYAEYLHKLTKDTQFIVITHRRGTMNAADILYGITMQEKGVSTLVSVNLLEKDFNEGLE